MTRFNPFHIGLGGVSLETSRVGVGLGIPSTTHSEFVVSAMLRQSNLKIDLRVAAHST